MRPTTNIQNVDVILWFRRAVGSQTPSICADSLPFRWREISGFACLASISWQPLSSCHPCWAKMPTQDASKAFFDKHKRADHKLFLWASLECGVHWLRAMCMSVSKKVNFLSWGAAYISSGQCVWACRKKCIFKGSNKSAYFGRPKHCPWKHNHSLNLWIAD